MGYSGLIYAAIVAAWLAVLVPRWVRRNEEVERARETDAANGVRVIQSPTAPPAPSHHATVRGDSARTIISGDPAGLAGAPTATGHPSEGRAVPGDGDAASAEGDGDATAADGDGDAPPAPGRPSQAELELQRLDRVFARAAMRRRRVLTALLLTTIVVVAGVFAGSVPAWAPAVSGGGLIGFLAMARRATVVQTSGRAALRRRMAREYAARTQQEQGEDMKLTDDGKRVAVLDPADLPEPPREGTWDPVDVPLPTYLTKPKAPQANRKIDLSQPGSWTSGRLELGKSFDLPSHAAHGSNGASAANGNEKATQAEAEDAAEDLPEKRRAVGE